MFATKSFFIKLVCLFFLLLNFSLIACSQKDADKVGDAQYCLDHASASTASQCLDKISGIETANAYIIRCSANFIQKGFGDPAQLVATFKNLDSSGSNTTTAFLAALNFGDTTFATQTYQYCLKSNQKGLTLLAAMVQSATSITALGNLISSSCPTTSTSSSAIQTCISGIVTSITSSTGQQAAAAIGQAVVAAYNVSCQTGSQANASLCSQISTAITATGSTDTTAIGTTLLQTWQSQ